MSEIKMTETRQEKPKNLIPKPVSQAFLAGASASSLAVVFGVPYEFAPRIALAGAGFSLYLSWSDSRHSTRPRKRRGRQIPFSSANGNQKIDMEFSTSQGGYIARETWGDTLHRWIYGKQEAKGYMKPIGAMPRPQAVDEFIFHSSFQGRMVQLREKHVKLFLASAWRNRKNGHGLSERRWVRNRSQRPAWYKELPNIWYYAMSMLLWNAQRTLNLQLVMTLGNQQSFLAVEPRELLCILKWYESERLKK